MGSSFNYMNEKERYAIERFRKAVKNNIGESVISISVFGSKVRGDYNEASDIDILVIVKERSLWVMDKIAEITSELNIVHNLSIAPVVFSENEYNMNKIMDSPFTVSVGAEGLSLP
jgi:predicted nucleotidyltransferase